MQLLTAILQHRVQTHTRTNLAICGHGIQRKVVVYVRAPCEYASACEAKGQVCPEARVLQAHARSENSAGKDQEYDEKERRDRESKHREGLVIPCKVHERGCRGALHWIGGK